VDRLAASTNRPGGDVTYTQNWPHEPLIGNQPTGGTIVWSVISFFLLLAGIGGMVWYFASQPRSEAEDLLPDSDPLLGLKPEPSQRATVKYFFVVAALWVVQVALGAITAEEIINALTQVHALRVIARTSAFAIKGKLDEVRQIAETLGVANILEGSVRKSGNHIRVMVQLITAADGSHLWSERYDTEMTDVFAVQDDIAQAVVDALKERLGAPESRRIQRQAADVEAYHLYVKARHHFWKLTAEGLATARQLLERAVAVDANYRLPHSELAHYYFLSTMQGRIPANEGGPRGIQEAEKALALDNTLGEAVGMRALLWALYGYRWQEALQELRRAIEMNPASALTPHWRAAVLTGLNRLPEAIHQQKQALRADPLLPLNHYFMTRLLVCRGDYERAYQHARLAVEIAPDFWLGHSALGLVHLYSGNLPAAIPELQGAQLGHYAYGWRGCACVLAGERAQAERLLAEIERVRQQRCLRVPCKSQHPAPSKHIDAAFARLESALRDRDFQLYALQTEPVFHKLRSDARYKDLLHQMKLA
jgi:adenylate cyclase